MIGPTAFLVRTIAVWVATLATVTALVYVLVEDFAFDEGWPGALSPHLRGPPIVLPSLAEPKPKQPSPPSQRPAGRGPTGAENGVGPDIAQFLTPPGVTPTEAQYGVATPEVQRLLEL